MRFFLVDDDKVIRSMLAEIIEDHDLGEIAGESENGIGVTAQLLLMKQIDILIIDLLMPLRDGIQTVRDLQPGFDGAIIMLSQVEDKEMIGKAYSLGVDYYITKPINRLEVINVIQKVKENLRRQKVLLSIEKNLCVLNPDRSMPLPSPVPKNSLDSAGQYLLAELGMISECGSKDLLDILEYLGNYEENCDLPSLKDIFTNVAKKRLRSAVTEENEIKKEAKAIEQRVRRAIFQGAQHVAALGIADYTNPNFEEYAPKFFDFTDIRKHMLKLETNVQPSIAHSHINVKKFVKVFFWESKKRQ
jgi:two-component system response regulator YcbB